MNKNTIKIGFLILLFYGFSYAQDKQIHIINLLLDKEILAVCEHIGDKVQYNFLGVDVVKSQNSDSLREPFRKNKNNFTKEYIIKHNIDAVVILSQKRPKSAINIFSAQKTTNAARVNSISLKKIPFAFLENTLHSTVLKHLNELLIIKTNKRKL